MDYCFTDQSLHQSQHASVLTNVHLLSKSNQSYTPLLPPPALLGAFLFWATFHCEMW